MTISDLDPNLVAGLFTLVASLATWAYGKARGTKQRDLSDLLDEAITAEVLDALEDRETGADIRGRLTKALTGLIERMKLKPAGYEVLIAQAVEWGALEFRIKLAERKANQEAAKQLPAQVKELNAATQRVVDAFTPKGLIDKSRARK